MRTTEAWPETRSERNLLDMASQTARGRLAAARDESDRLFSIVKPEFLYTRPIPERHRIVFYMGHLEAFDWNLFRERLPGITPFHPEFDQLFAFGIDPVGGGLPTDQPEDWPSLEHIRNYNARIRETLDTAIDAGASRGGRDEVSLEVLLNVAIEHRLMHAETLAYMFHQLDPEMKKHPIRQDSDDMSAGAGEYHTEMMGVPAGAITLGLSSQSGKFGWDNEFEAHTVAVPGFEIDRYPVTNGQFFEFILAGGYENPRYWSAADWKWKSDNRVSHPAFWRRSGDDWTLRTMFGQISLPLDWPVYVSHAEASAYARWAGKSLPTEVEWQRSAYGSREGLERPYPWGSEPPTPKHGNFDFHRWDPAPVHAFPAGDSAWGVSNLLGNGWEWTSSAFESFRGFQPFPFYPGYSANFFDGQHYVMKGGSARTAACMLRSSFRNWFQPHYPYVYAGFRCVNR